MVTTTTNSNNIKGCKVCTEFKNWSKKKPQADSSGEKTSSNHPNPKIDSESSREHSSNAIGNDDGKSFESKFYDYKECPPDGTELGRSTWTFLHTMASYYPENPDDSTKQAAVQIMQGISKLYPCSYCAHHLAGELVHNPPKVENREQFERWMCDMHNEVNLRQGKPVFNCDFARQRWKEGCSE